MRYTNSRFSVEYVCVSCGKSLFNEFYTLCARCKNYTLCMSCFSVGTQSGTHFRTHSFVFITPKTLSIFEEGWSIHEEICLLKAMQLYSLDNWGNIARFVKTKTPVQCETHYFTVYIRSPTSPLPIKSVKLASPLFSFNEADSSKKQPPKLKNPSLGEQAGYNPFRHEFNLEYMNEAEDLVVDIQFSEDDSYSHFEQKMLALTSYNNILEERRLRSRVVEDWGLVNGKIPGFGGISLEEKEFDSLLVPFAPYLGKKKTMKFTKRFHFHLQMRTKIEKYLTWQLEGITDEEEGILHDALEAIVKDDAIPPGEVDRWNLEVQKLIEHFDREETSDSKYLSKEEIDLCLSEGIEVPLFNALKTLLVRETSVRGSLSLSEALELSQGMQREIRILYKFFHECGWV